jgi:drug/metabolite transporter (DMT)-like permease
MTGAVAYALAAMVCYGLGDFVYKRAARAGVGAHHFLMSQGWVFCPLVVLYAWLSGNFPHSLPALWGAVAGLFIFLGFYNFLRSLTTGPVSINAPIFRLNFVVTVVLAALILAEPVSIGRLAGIAAAVAAAWLLLGGGAGKERARLPGRSLRQVLVASAAYGLANFSHKLGLVGGAAPEALLAAQALVFVSLATLSTWSAEGHVRPPPETWAHSVPAALLLIAAFLFFLHGLRTGDATVLVPIAQMGFVPAALLGIAAFGEPPTGRTLAGLAVAVAALTLLALG